MREFLSPADLSEAQTFHIYELVEVIVVGKYENFLLIVF